MCHTLNSNNMDDNNGNSIYIIKYTNIEENSIIDGI